MKTTPGRCSPVAENICLTIMVMFTTTSDDKRDFGYLAIARQTALPFPCDMNCRVLA